MTVTFTVPGDPVPKKRPRLGKIGDKPVVYTPAETRAYEQVVATVAKVAMAGRDKLTGPLSAQMTFWLPIPPSWKGVKLAEAIAGNIAPTSYPDVDNLVKSLLDGCNGIVFRDDAQIVSLSAQKCYVPDAKPRAVVRFWEGS